IEQPQPGPAVIGPDGGIVQGSDGSLVAIGPGALPDSTVVGITPMGQSDLPMSIPTALKFAGAFNLDLGGEQAQAPLQVAVPVAAGIAPGTKVYFYQAGSLPDETGTWIPTWLEDEVGVVGPDGFARTSSPPYPGLLSAGPFLVGVADVPLGEV